MFGRFSKADLEKLLAAGGTSLESVLRDAGKTSQALITSTTAAIDKHQATILSAQAAIARDTKEREEAQAVANLVHSLGG